MDIFPVTYLQLALLAQTISVTCKIIVQLNELIMSVSHTCR